MADCPDCGEDHDNDILAYQKRAAEAVVSASKADRAGLNKRAQEAINDARKAWPNVSDEDLSKFFQSQATLVRTFSQLDVLNLANVLDAVFTNCTIASAALSDVYDLGDIDAPKTPVDDLLAEAKERRTAAEESLDKNTGMFL